MIELTSLSQLDSSSQDHEARKDNFIKNRYSAMSPDRDRALRKARAVAELTLPILYPPEGWTKGEALAQPNQSMGGRGITSLASKILTTVYPSTADFFKTVISDDLRAEVEAQDAEIKAAALQQGVPEAEASPLTKIEAQLVARDESIKRVIRSLPDRKVFMQGIIHCLVSGLVCFFKPNLWNMKLYTLESFVCRLDGSGKLIELIVEDKIDPASFSAKQLKEITGHDLDACRRAGITSITVYVRMLKGHDEYDIQVEALGKPVKSMEGSFDEDSPPFFVVPFFSIPGHSYAASYGELIFGNLWSLENTERAKNRMASLAADCKIGIKRGAAISPTDWQLASGDDQPVIADKDDVTFLVAPVAQNLQQLMAVIQEQRQAVGTDFLLFSAIRREAERVPTAEILRTAAELDETLTGFFTELGSTFQAPYLSRTTKLCEQEKMIPTLGKDVTRTVLTAGIETLQDNVEAQNLDTYLARLLTVLPNQATELNDVEVRERMASQSRVPTNNLFKSAEQVNQEMQAAQLQAFVQNNPQALAQMAQTATQGGPPSGQVNQQAPSPEEAGPTAGQQEQVPPG